MSLSPEHTRAILAAAINVAQKRIDLAAVEREMESLTMDGYSHRFAEIFAKMSGHAMEVDHAVGELTNAVIAANIAHVAEGN